MSERLLTAADVAELLAVPVSWVREATREGRLPHLALGRYRRYSRAAIDAWLTAARDAFADASGVAPANLVIDEHAEAILLDLARIAAHTSGQRTNAPLVSYLAGLAVARGADIDSLAHAIRSSR